MPNTRFSTALHIMTLLAVDEQAWLTSSHIANSLGVQPAAVRKEVLGLKAAGLVHCREGKYGGIRLARPASGIRLSEIYECISDSHLFEKVKTPNQDCFIGKQVNLRLDGLFSALNDAFSGELKRLSLAQFYKRFE